MFIPPRNGGHRRDADREHRVANPWTQRRGDRERQNQGRKCLDGVHYAHDHRPEFAPRETSDQSKGDAEGERNPDRDDANFQRDSRTINDAGEDVSTGVVGAQQVFRGRRHRQLGVVLPIGRIGRDHVGEQGAEHGDRQDD